ncbi:MAG: PilZ domain-containing protein [Nitrospiraceae bacterium]|nr:PilZ domain-containing protein [Nitrospiraceae bacterium]
MAKLRYCERVHTHFPVVFAGEAYVGEGTVLNVSVLGCAVHSRKRVQPSLYLETRMLVPDITSPLRVGLARVRWCEGRRFGVEFIQMSGEDQVRLGRSSKMRSLSRCHLDPAHGKGRIPKNNHTS